MIVIYTLWRYLLKNLFKHHHFYESNEETNPSRVNFPKPVFPSHGKNSFFIKSESRPSEDIRRIFKKYIVFFFWKLWGNKWWDGHLCRYTQEGNGEAKETIIPGGEHNRISVWLPDLLEAVADSFFFFSRTCIAILITVK